MKTIPLHQLAAYLPYKTKVTFKYKGKDVIGTLNAVYDDGTIVCHDTVNASPDKFKLMLVPFEKYDTKNYMGIVPIRQIKDTLEWGDVDYLQNRYLQFALRNHIDIFDLIPQGLAVEKLSTSVKGME
jgi:hypothetical protein